MIDEAKPGEVGVIVMEGTLDIAAMGNLMATAAIERGMAGMVLDGAIRDVWDIRRMGLTVYARSKSPRTAVGHYATVAKNVPVECAGVTVRPGDIIVADEDGVVVVPQEHAADVLKAGAGHRRPRTRHVSVHPQFKSLQRRSRSSIASDQQAGFSRQEIVRVGGSARSQPLHQVDRCAR